MATADKIASGGDWYISLWTADTKVWVQKNGGVHVVSEKAHEECGSSWKGELPKETRQAATFRAQGALDKRGGHSRAQCVPKC
jgi:hypothetical protein